MSAPAKPAGLILDDLDRQIMRMSTHPRTDQAALGLLRRARAEIERQRQIIRAHRITDRPR